ncbi:MAG: long-chain fatty acid--CoA ligase, partial [Saprospiraceae bacterium]|nr:long-chain fatty acid--CoA ligase [Saprospiraceae bacterium]
WVVADLAMLQLGIITVPVYPTISTYEYTYIFNDAEVKYCFIGDGDLKDKISAVKANVLSFIDVITFDQQDAGIYWKDLFKDSHQDQINTIKQSIDPYDLATIIYTSGTTGNPKGVMLSHNNIVSNVTTIIKLIPINGGERTISFLPLCHVFERAVLYAYIYACVSVTFCGTDNLGGESGDLKRVRPHFFSTVPRLLEKVYDKIMAKGIELSGVKKMIFFWALSLTDDYEYDKTYSGFGALKHKIADKLIFSKWREALGGNIKGIISGAAPLSEKIARTFSAAGIPIREGYGLTETSPGIAIGRFDKDGALLGSIGPVIDGVKVIFDNSDTAYAHDEGEILVNGPNIMMGYFKKPDQTSEVMKEINGEKWFCTGDIGKFITNKQGNKFLKITDRKKELLKTSGGKYVAPAPIESKLKEHYLVENVMIVGDNKKFVSALIIPATHTLQDWCEKHSIAWTNKADIIKLPKVIERYQHIIDNANRDFGQIEKVKKFALIDSDWEAMKKDGSLPELTPTLKLKRRVILTKYAQDIEKIYSE